MTVRIATRRSSLALWQTEHVIGLLHAQDPTLHMDVVSLDTAADRRLDVPISEIGGKGVFCKQVQQMVLAGEADLAVHSAKDLQAQTPDGLLIAAIPERGDSRDALVGGRLDQLTEGAVIATGSQRRRTQLAELRPDLRFADLRGNIATRLAQLDEFDALVMAAVALERLGLSPEVVDVLEPEVMLPQVGQGALAVECREDDLEARQLLATIDHLPSRTLVEAERDFLLELGGDCDLPAGAHARSTETGLLVVGMLAGIGRPATVHRASVSGADDDRPGQTLARRLQARL